MALLLALERICRCEILWHVAGKEVSAQDGSQLNANGPNSDLRGFPMQTPG